MWILIVASFIVMTMPEIHCWPSTSNIAAMYSDKHVFLNFEELEKADAMHYLIIAFKNFHYVENVNVTLGEI